MNISNPSLNLIAGVILIWELVWKGIALWKSAKNSHSYWFIAILILNTVGVLPIAYLILDKYYFNKAATSSVVKSTKLSKKSK